MPQCTAMFCENEATTIVRIKPSKYNGRQYCDECTEHVKENIRPGNMFYGKWEFIPIERRMANVL